MTKLSDTQRVILSKAAQNEALLAEPPKHLPAAARQSVMRSLLAKGLLEEVAAPREHIDLALRQDEDGAWLALRVTAAGLRAIGIDAADALPRDDGLALQQPTKAPETSDLTAEPQQEALAAFQPTPPPSSAGAAEGLSIGTQTGPPIGVQKGPPFDADERARDGRRGAVGAAAAIPGVAVPSVGDQARFLNRQLSLPVSTMSQ